MMSIPPCVSLLAGSLCLGVLTLPASAEAIDIGKEGALLTFAPAKAGARACYARVYDAAHLKKHPSQRVTSMAFRIAYYIHEPDEYRPLGQRNYYFELDTTLRGKSEKITAGGECSSSTGNNAIFCGVECDGGGVLVRQMEKPGKILVDLEAAGRIRMSVSCDEGDENTIDLEPGEDDKTFLLTQLPAESCPDYEDW